MALSVLLRPTNQQAAFNLKRWAELQNDPALARLPHRIETDRLGRSLMSPPSAPAHGQALYFEAGAQEVWICDLDGFKSYHVGQRENRCSLSAFCPEFPTSIFPRAKRG